MQLGPEESRYGGSSGTGWIGQTIDFESCLSFLQLAPRVYEKSGKALIESVMESRKGSDRVSGCENGDTAQPINGGDCLMKTK